MDIQKVETRGRPRNSKIEAICLDLRRIALAMAPGEGEDLRLTQIKRRVDCKIFRESAGYRSLRRELMAQGYTVSLFYHKKQGVLVRIHRGE